MIRTYSELSKLTTFEDRFRYLKLDGIVGKETFGFDRYLNQVFYQSQRWKSIRNQVIIRDCGCDLGISGREINDRVYIHHMNPLTLSDIENESDYMVNPEFLITTTFNTHQAIHYSNEDLLLKDFVERSRNDTCPWKQS